MEHRAYLEHGVSGKKRSDPPSRPVSSNQWGSLEELADNPEFRKWSDSEFLIGASEFVDPLARREFVRLMGASLAVMAVSGCHRPPQQKIVPHVEQPELLVSGRPLFFATAMPFNASATGILVQSNEGRPTKIEGNPSHPLSLGATSIFEQAAILTLYDPDRSKTIIHGGQIETWESFLSAWLPEQDRQLSQGGRTLRFLIDSVTSPTLVWQVGQLQKRYPGAKWYQWEPISQATIIEGYRAIFGRPAQPQYRLSEADVIVAFDSDFLFDSPFRLANTRAFAGRRNYQRPDFSNPNRLYVAEPSPTITGSMAELRLPIAARQIGLLVQLLANRLGVGDPGPKVDDPQFNAWIDACVTELQAARGRSVVLAGFRQSPLIHRWIHAINVSLGNVGRTITYREVPGAFPQPFEGIAQLARELDSGRAETIIVLGGNPAFDTPVDLEFQKGLSRSHFSLHLSLYYDETSAACQWHIPENHFLESWSDATASDGSTGIIQPLIAPLYGGHSRHELVALFLGQISAQDYDIIRIRWDFGLSFEVRSFGMCSQSGPTLRSHWFSGIPG